MTPILCVGETLDQREAGMAESTVSGQLVAALKDRDAEALGSIVVAYEPIWAIGTGLTRARTMRSRCRRRSVVGSNYSAATYLVPC